MWERIVLIPVFVVILLSAAKAQENPAAPPAAPATEQPAAESAPAAMPTPPPPGAEVMRPTTHGLRLTPEIARSFARIMAVGEGRFRDELKTTPEQQKQLGERYARRLMDVARKHEKEMQPAIEQLITTMVAHGPELDSGMKLTPEEAREFGQRCLPVAMVGQELVDGLEQDTDSVLTPEQKEIAKKHMQEARDGAKHMEEVLKRWAEGGYREGDNPFDNGKPHSADGGGSAGKDGTSHPAKPEMRQAEAVADSQIGRFGPSEWRRLLEEAKTAFAFDDQQKAKADQLLADYTAKADAIMTPEWKQAMRTNRIKMHLNNWLRGQPSRPFVFHLNQENARLSKPVTDLGQAFRADLLAIATPEQRAAAVTEVQNTAATLGLTMNPTDEPLLGLAATTQPAAAGTP